MASGFFALLDEIAILMDDVAGLTKTATQKTAGILADDLAVNADKASGFLSSRELPVLWSITKGSFLNKAIILPVVFLLSAYFPIAILLILFIGGAFLAFEGAEKIYEYLFQKGKAKSADTITKMSQEEAKKEENNKIRSAIIVDFILSVEIVIIALGTVMEEPINLQILVVTAVALIATVGVYGLVALLVRMDDLGYKLISLNNKSGFFKSIGRGLVISLPLIIRTLGVLGTLAMILVAGGIFVHNLEPLHHLVHALPTILGEFLVGLAIGIVSLLLYKMIKALVRLLG